MTYSGEYNIESTNWFITAMIVEQGQFYFLEQESSVDQYEIFEY